MNISTKEVYRCRLAFFGLTSEYIQAVYENFLFMIKDYNWSFTEMYMLPVALRRWYIDKAYEMAKKMNEASN